jgi:hypothetical protein
MTIQRKVIVLWGLLIKPSLIVAACSMSACPDSDQILRRSEMSRCVPEAEELKLSLFRSQHQHAEHDRYDKQRGHVRN